jgi:hypothetical protein
MCQGLQAGQTEESAGALDGVHQTEDVAQHRRVGGVALEPHELGVDGVEVLGALGQEFAQKVVHRFAPGLGGGPAQAAMLREASRT